ACAMSGAMGAVSIAPPLGPRHPHAIAPTSDGDGAAIAPHAPFRLDLDVPTAARFIDHHTRAAGTDANVDIGLRQPNGIGFGGSGEQRRGRQHGSRRRIMVFIVAPPGRSSWSFTCGPTTKERIPRAIVTPRRIRAGRDNAA